MASEQDRGLNIFHHNKKEGEPQLNDTLQTEDGVTKASQDAKDHKRNEHIAEAAALAAGAGAVGVGGYAWHEHHEKKGDQKEAEGF